MKGIAIMGIGVLFVMISFAPFVLSIVYPPEEYSEPISLVGVTNDVVQRILTLNNNCEEPIGTLYTIYVNQDLIILDIIDRVYINGNDITDNIMETGCCEIELDNTKPVVFEYIIYGKRIKREIDPKFHTIHLDMLELPPEYQATGSVIAHFDTKLENGFLFATAPANVIIDNENRFVVVPENENAVTVLMFNLQKRENEVDGYITLLGTSAYIKGTLTSMELLVKPENNIFAVNISFKLDNEYADNLNIEGIGASVWLENVEFVSLEMENKILYTISDVGNISIDIDGVKYYGETISFIIIQPMTATAVLSVVKEEKPRFWKENANIWFLSFMVAGLILLGAGLSSKTRSYMVR